MPHSDTPASIHDEISALFSWNPLTPIPLTAKNSSTTSPQPAFYDNHFSDTLVLRCVRHLPSLTGSKCRSRTTCYLTNTSRSHRWLLHDERQGKTWPWLDGVEALIGTSLIVISNVLTQSTILSKTFNLASSTFCASIS